MKIKSVCSKLSPLIPGVTSTNLVNQTKSLKFDFMTQTLVGDLKVHKLFMGSIRG